MEPIEVESVEFYPKDNAKDHNTTEYDLVHNIDMPTPIYRRGNNFYFAIRFNRDFDEEHDVIRVGFNFGPRPSVIKGTKVILPLLVRVRQLPNEPYRWYLAVNNIEGNIATLQVHIPPTVPVGIWNCSIQSNISGKRDQRNDYKVESDIYILFNPWCELDGVYMSDEEERKEYILNESGKIWCGTFKNPKGKHWIYGQFDEVVLPAACLLMEKSGLHHADRGSPVLVARAISAVINSVDDDGLLVGRWDGNYEDGTSPHAWTGSTSIMEQYLMTGGTSVKYGQCWVYSAATVTVCRTLGIPCRPTTNYISAHDTNCSLTVDKYFDLFGNRIENGPEGDCNDSCWNFHVWNDVWMNRPDLPHGYGGWQIIDATPQEQSDKIFRCGPASVEAVRRGEIGYLYDTPFVFSEVNADVVHFQEDEESDWGFKRLSVNQYHVGRKIATKKPGPVDTDGDSDMMIVTTLYKNLEGTEEERLAVYNAVRGVPKAQHFYEIPDEDKADLIFDLIDIGTIPFGQPFDVEVHVENRSNDVRTVTAVLSAGSVFYTGSIANEIKSTQNTFLVNPGERETLKITITPEEYLEKLVDHNLIKIYSIANVKETRQTWSEEDDFTLINPPMTIEFSGVCAVGEQCEVSFTFQNPLKIPLTNCTYTVEGPGYAKPKVVEYRNVEPEEIVYITESFTAKRAGERQIVVVFNSKEIHGIDGSVKVVIQ